MNIYAGTTISILKRRQRWKTSCFYEMRRCRDDDGSLMTVPCREESLCHSPRSLGVWLGHSQTSPCDLK